MTMTTFSIRDLRERTGELVRTAEAGELSVIAKHGQPVFVAVPFDETLVASGVNVALALKLFRDHVVSLGKAAKLARMDNVKFMSVLGAHGIPAVDYPASDLTDELAVLAAE